jgi:hypothetical protein
MWRGTSSWQRTVQLVKMDGAGKSAGRQAREDSRPSGRRARAPRGGPRAAGASSSDTRRVGDGKRKERKSGGGGWSDICVKHKKKNE